MDGMIVLTPRLPLEVQCRLCGAPNAACGVVEVEVVEGSRPVRVTLIGAQRPLKLTLRKYSAPSVTVTSCTVMVGGMLSAISSGVGSTMTHWGLMVPVATARSILALAAPLSTTLKVSGGSSTSSRLVATVRGTLARVAPSGIVNWRDSAV